MPAPESETNDQRRKRALERLDEPERKSWRVDSHDNGPPPDNTPRRRRDKDFGIDG